MLTGIDEAESLFERMCRACTAAVAVSEVALALMTAEGHAGTVAATDATAEALEGLQYALGEGPCFDAWRVGRPVLEPNLAITGTAQWPAFTDGALQAGTRAVFSFPVKIGVIRLGVLNLYRDTPGPLEQRQLTEVLAFAETAATILLHLCPTTATSDSLHPELARAVDSHRVIHHATGMIAAQSDVDIRHALLLLRANAFASGRPILEVAHAVVARRLRFTPLD